MAQQCSNVDLQLLTKSSRIITQEEKNQGASVVVVEVVVATNPPLPLINLGATFDRRPLRHGHVIRRYSGSVTVDQRLEVELGGQWLLAGAFETEKVLKMKAVMRLKRGSHGCACGCMR
jgi:hypothetical protein